jgi:hypothetical protein
MKYIVITSIVLGIIGVFMFGPDGFLFLGLSSFVFGFLILKFFDNRCSKCGKWFSYKKINENYTDIMNVNIFSDNVYATQNITYECIKCKNRINSSRKVTKELKGNSNYELNKILNKNKNKYKY